MVHTTSLRKVVTDVAGLENWNLKEKMPFKVSEVFHSNNAKAGISFVSEPFSMLTANLTETERMHWKNGQLASQATTTPERYYSMMEQTCCHAIHFSTMSFAAIGELTTRQSVGGKGRLTTTNANLFFAYKEGGFHQFLHKYDWDNPDYLWLAKNIIPVIVIWDPMKKGWYVNRDSVDNPFLWPIGTRFHFIYFSGF